MHFSLNAESEIKILNWLYIYQAFPIFIIETIT